MPSIDDDQYESRYERLASQVEKPEAWIPEPGDTLVGEAVQWDAVTIERDGSERTCDVLTVRDPAGKEHSVWTWHTVLQNELVGKVEPGDFVALNYRGRRPKMKGDGDYAAYRVAVEKGENMSSSNAAAEPSGDDDLPF
jgi:hypothetical protein